MSHTNSILAVGAHPDDIEFTAAGTLALLRARGYPITLATMTAGDCGSAELGPDEIMRLRRDEAAASARILAADYVCLEERDIAIDYNTATRRKVTELIRQVRPFLVLTHPLQDYLCDHEITGRLVRDACFTASMPNFVGTGDAPPTEAIPALYHWDPIECTDERGHATEPEIVIDIGSAIGTKRAMLECHTTQREWLMRQHGMDEYVESMLRWSAARGALIGAAFGEGFAQHRGHPYPRKDVLRVALDHRS